MNLQTYCQELEKRIPGCLNVTIYDLNNQELTSSNENKQIDNTQYFIEEKVYDEVSKIGRGNHFATTLVLNNINIIIINCQTVKIFLHLELDANIGLVYSLIPSIQSTFSSI